MPTTTRLALPYPTVDDEPRAPAQMQALAERLDVVVVTPDPGDLKFSARTGEHGAWIKADGRALTAGQYTALRDALIADGSPFGNTSGNPKIPDMRGREPVGAGTGAGLSARVAGQQGGAETHTLTDAQMPTHAHGYSAAQDVATVDAGSYVTLARGVSISTGAAGGGQAHPNMGPYTVGTWFIYTAA